MQGRVFVTGASGFVGWAMVQELARRGHGVNALVHRRELPPLEGDVRSIQGSLLDDKALDAGIAGCAAVIHLVGIIREKPSRGITFENIHHQATRRVVAAALRQGVPRYLHMSALGTRADAVSNYHKTKWAAEQYVRGSGLQWTIFRPSMIHGPGGEFMMMEARWARMAAPPFLFMPYFGPAPGMLQPVFVDDVARAFVDALGNPKTIGQTYEMGGAQRLSWPQLHRLSSRAIVGRERWTMPLPGWLARMLVAVVPAALLPFNRDQIIMSQEDNTCDLTHFTTDFGWTPVAFADALGGYARKIGRDQAYQ